MMPGARCAEAVREDYNLMLTGALTLPSLIYRVQSMSLNRYDQRKNIRGGGSECGRRPQNLLLVQASFDRAR
jgi:hypothetical protein